MSPLLSDQSRLLALIIGATILWCVESLGPLYGYDKHRLRRALPNIALTVSISRYEFGVVSHYSRRCRYRKQRKAWAVFPARHAILVNRTVRHYGLGSVYILRARVDA